MYSVYAILKVEDRYDQSEPYGSVEATSNYEEELMDKLYDLYNDYVTEVLSYYPEEDRQQILNQIQWDRDRRGFTDTNGYKQSTRYVLVRLQ